MSRPAPSLLPELTRSAVSLLLVLITCVALAACGSSSKSKSSSSNAVAAASTPSSATTPTTATTSSSATPTTPTKKTSEERSQPAIGQSALIASVAACMRSHGIPLPEPDANNKVNLHGIDVKSHHYQTVGKACYAAAVKQQEQAAASPPARGR
jgi:pyruvate/2-oxoglutarate dehydrogenase complex dihydrolipoamide acyltransferase (E2) component